MLLVEPKKLRAVRGVSLPFCTIYTSALLDNTCSAPCAEGRQVVGGLSIKVPAFALSPRALFSQLLGPPASWHSQK